MTAHHPQATPAQLAELLDRSIDEAEGLCESLAAEREALARRDADELERVLVAKTGYVERLTLLDAERNRLFPVAGPGAVPGESVAGQDPAIESRWTRLLELADECARLNRANGNVIRARQSHVDARLKVIRGEPMAAATYELGNTRAGHRHRSLAEA